MAGHSTVSVDPPLSASRDDFFSPISVVASSSSTPILVIESPIIEEEEDDWRSLDEQPIPKLISSSGNTSDDVVSDSDSSHSSYSNEFNQIYHPQPNPHQQLFKNENDKSVSVAVNMNTLIESSLTARNDYNVAQPEIQIPQMQQVGQNQSHQTTSPAAEKISKPNLSLFAIPSRRASETSYDRSQSHSSAHSNSSNQQPPNLMSQPDALRQIDTSPLMYLHSQQIETTNNTEISVSEPESRIINITDFVTAPARVAQPDSDAISIAAPSIPESIPPQYFDTDKITQVVYNKLITIVRWFYFYPALACAMVTVLIFVSILSS
jgi:hypothetical protein